MSQAMTAAPEQGRRQAPYLPAVALIPDSRGLSAADRARLAEVARHPGSSAGLLPARVAR
jgi:hypothetical protein